MADPVRVLLVTGGHPFQRDAFLAVFDDNPDLSYRHVEQPVVLSPAACTDVDVVVLYDMPGIEFTGGDPPARLLPPPAEVREGFEALLAEGMPMVFLHHAVAGWPAWNRYADIVGARFHYLPGRLDGREWPDSGYRFDVTHEVEVVDPTHPVCAGLPARFALTDELYLFPVLDRTVTPLLRSRATFTDDHFFSAGRAIRGDRESRSGWSHPPGSDLVAWTKRAGNATIVYLQFGDGPATYADADYRQVLANAIAWAATTSAATRSPSGRTVRPGDVSQA